MMLHFVLEASKYNTMSLYIKRNKHEVISQSLWNTDDMFSQFMSQKKKSFLKMV